MWMAAAMAVSAYVSYEASQQARRDAAAARQQQDVAMGQQDRAMEQQVAALDRQTEVYRKAQEESMAFQRENLDFQMQQYTDWQDTFGPIQENLAGFYSNLSEADVTASGLQSLREQYASVEQNMRQQAQARGIDSAALDQMGVDLNIRRAEQESQLRQNARFMVADQKSRFLATSGQIQNPYASGVSNAYTNMATGAQVGGQAVGQAAGNFANLYGQQGGMYGSRAGMYGNQAGQYSQNQQLAMQGLGQTLTGAAQYGAYYATQQEELNQRRLDREAYGNQRG